LFIVRVRTVYVIIWENIVFDTRQKPSRLRHFWPSNAYIIIMRRITTKIRNYRALYSYEYIHVHIYVYICTLAAFELPRDIITVAWRRRRSIAVYIFRVCTRTRVICKCEYRGKPKRNPRTWPGNIFKHRDKTWYLYYIHTYI